MVPPETKTIPMDITDIQEFTHQTPTDLMGGVVAMAGLRTINRSPAMVVQADTAPTRGMTSRLAAPVMVGMVAIVVLRAA